MAWTAPRTWSDGELVTAAIMNTHVRDNLNEVGPHVRKYKAIDQNVAASTTYVNDADFFFTIGANEKWIVDIEAPISFKANADGKMRWTVPAGCTGYWWRYGQNGSSSGTIFDTTGQTPIATEIVFGGSVDYAQGLESIHCTFINSTTAGTAQFQFACLAATEFLTFLAGGHMIGHRIG